MGCFEGCSKRAGTQLWAASEKFGTFFGLHDENSHEFAPLFKSNQAEWFLELLLLFPRPALPTHCFRHDRCTVSSLVGIALSQLVSLCSFLSPSSNEGKKKRTERTKEESDLENRWDGYDLLPVFVLQFLLRLYCAHALKLSEYSAERWTLWSSHTLLNHRALHERVYALGPGDVSMLRKDTQHGETGVAAASKK